MTDTTPSSRDAAIPAGTVERARAVLAGFALELCLQPNFERHQGIETVSVVDAVRAMLAFAAEQSPPSTGQAGVERVREAEDRAFALGMKTAATHFERDYPDAASIIRARPLVAALDPLPSLSGSEVVASTTASVDIPAGMKPWSGGSRAPDDWDGGPVLFRSRQMSVESPAWCWEWGKPPHSYDIIAYTPQEDTPISGFEAREWLVSQEAQADQLPGKLLYTGQQMIAAFAAGRSALAQQAHSGQRESGEVEERAWSWLESEWLNVEAGHDPSDRDYSPDEMVDAFMAGHEAALAQQAHSGQRESGEVERNVIAHAIGKATGTYVLGRSPEWAYDAADAVIAALAAIDPAQQGVVK